MEKIINFLKNKSYCYSMHTFAWISWIYFLSFHVAYQILATTVTDVQLGQVIVWYCIVFGTIIYLPIMNFAILLTYFFILEKERINPDFLIKQNRITSNIIYKIFIFISYILGWSFLIFLTTLSLGCIWGISHFAVPTFIRFCLPILILELVIYLLLRKKYLLKK